MGGLFLLSNYNHYCPLITLLCYCYNVIKQLSLLRVTSTGQVVPADVSSLLIQCEL